MTNIDFLRFLRLPLIAVAMLTLAACGSKDDTPAEIEAPVQAATQPEAAPAETEAKAEAEPIAAIEESDGSADPAEESTESLRLAQADAPVSATPAARFREGEHYNRYRPARMKVSGTDDIEVAEAFWYGCSHCYNLEPILRRWSADLPDGVQFVKLPAVWNPTLEKHAQLFYTVEALAGAGKLDDAGAVHQAIFNAIHQERNPLASTRSMSALLERFGVSESDFESTWESFEVVTKLRQAKTLNRNYQIASVPTMVVNGKYVTSETLAGSKDRLLAIIDELVASEQTR
jgi:thiol:disulfide interchange protein DsbA